MSLSECTGVAHVFEGVCVAPIQKGASSAASSSARRGRRRCSLFQDEMDCDEPCCQMRGGGGTIRVLQDDLHCSELCREARGASMCVAPR